MRYAVSVRPLEKPRNWATTERLEYSGIEVPIEFKTDGASIPVGLRWLFPHGGKKFTPAVFHDYCYKTGCVPRDVADKYFLEMLMENNVGGTEAKSMYYAVRIFGWLFYNKGVK